MAVRTLLPTADEWDGLGQINTAMQVPPPYIERPGWRPPHIANYRIPKMIGKGNFAKVNIARHILTKRKVALKTNDKTQLNLSTLQKVQSSPISRLYQPMTAPFLPLRSL
uniref:Uncharacterized protein n=1 Tax=Eptatretus burgeri TaxID=7764 RepID=A0A8C4R3G5_EPTBU